MLVYTECFFEGLRLFCALATVDRASRALSVFCLCFLAADSLFSREPLLLLLNLRHGTHIKPGSAVHSQFGEGCSI